MELRSRKLWEGVGQEKIEYSADEDVGEVEKLNSWTGWCEHGLTFAWLFFVLIVLGNISVANGLFFYLMSNIEY